MMGSFYTAIVVGVLLSIFVSVIIAETPLDEVGNINTYYKDGGKSKDNIVRKYVIILIFVVFQKGQIDRNNPKVKELLTKNDLDEK